MKHLMIRDLAVTEELDRNAMAGVHGGILILPDRLPIVPFDRLPFPIDVPIYRNYSPTSPLDPRYL